MDKLLPFLRATAVGLIVLTLAGPTLKKRFRERAKRQGFDLSGWIRKHDHSGQAYVSGKEILLAERHGWLPQDQQLIDPALYEAADLLSAARSEAQGSNGRTDCGPEPGSCRIRRRDENAAGMLKGKDYQVVLPEERRGSLRHEVWEGIPGSDLNSLTSHPKFKSGGPDFTGYLGATQSPTNAGDDFGRKISGILTPPEDGAYRFWLYADDQCILKLNDAGENPDRAKEILRIPSHTPADWGQALESRPVSLRKDRRYYFEILHKEGGGDDFCAVGWTLPNGSLERPIPGKRFLVPNLDRTLTFSELLQSMNEELVEVAQSLQGKRRHRRCGHAQSSFRIGRQVPLFRG